MAVTLVRKIRSFAKKNGAFRSRIADKYFTAASISRFFFFFSYSFPMKTPPDEDE